MGRPRIGQRLRVHVPDEVVDGLLMIAAHRGQTLPEVMRDALADYVKRVLRRGRAA
jgi:predicted transcriptional regulator